MYIGWYFTNHSSRLQTTFKVWGVWFHVWNLDYLCAVCCILCAQPSMGDWEHVPPEKNWLSKFNKANKATLTTPVDNTNFFPEQYNEVEVWNTENIGGASLQAPSCLWPYFLVLFKLSSSVFFTYISLPHPPPPPTHTHTWCMYCCNAISEAQHYPILTDLRR